MDIWQAILRIALTSLLSGLVVVIIVVFLNLCFTDKSLYQILLSRKMIILSFLAFLILLMPIVLSYIKGVRLSQALTRYMKELLLSIVVVATFSVTWKMLGDPASIRRRFETLYMATRRVMTFLPAVTDCNAVQPVSSAAFSSGQSGTGLDDTFLALDRGDIEPETAEERLQFHALDKFMQGEDTGLYELREMARYNGGLCPSVKTRLEYLQQAHPEKFTWLQPLLP